MKNFFYNTLRFFGCQAKALDNGISHAKIAIISDTTTYLDNGVISLVPKRVTVSMNNAMIPIAINVKECDCYG